MRGKTRARHICITRPTWPSATAGLASSIATTCTGSSASSRIGSHDPVSGHQLMNGIGGQRNADAVPPRHHVPVEPGRPAGIQHTELEQRHAGQHERRAAPQVQVQSALKNPVVVEPGAPPEEVDPRAVIGGIGRHGWRRGPEEISQHGLCDRHIECGPLPEGNGDRVEEKSDDEEEPRGQLSEREEQHPADRVQAEDVAVPESIGVNEPEDEQPEVTHVEEPRHGSRSRRGALSEDHDPGSEEHREDRDELVFEKDVRPPRR